ncbi:glycoside hydrolase family 130 protein [Marinifilum caeruleilacunae]|uniref:Glycosidase n=1 Tax=Marinifilum caeruleilacunae TaxID=2499076 RepID=A0ABX1WQ92_9BACT|nr:glycosidase [Marinifilum caeruleilacunae]NOU58254.1 glycosidase [Marinifilum caeruleilacunae]
MKRHSCNPLISPKDVMASHPSFQVLGAFNPGAVKYQGETILLLRVAENCLPEKDHITIPYYNKGEALVMKVDKDDPDLIYKDTRGYFYKGVDYLTTISHIRLARSKDGVNFEVENQPFIYPTLDCECFGVEDARIVHLNNTYYINYTAVSGDGYVTYLAETKDFKTVKKLGIIFPPLNKDVAFFPEKINGKFAAIHRPDNKGFGLPSIWYATSPDMMNWGEHFCLLRPDNTKSEQQKIGGGSSPIKTEKGWLVLYHAKGENSVYTLKLLLLDLQDPTKIIKKADVPVLLPETEYEKNGFFPNVVFTNGMVEEDDGELWVYYGACDETVCLARTSITDLLNHFN